MGIVKEHLERNKVNWESVEREETCLACESVKNASPVALSASIGPIEYQCREPDAYVQGFHRHCLQWSLKSGP